VGSTTSNSFYHRPSDTFWFFLARCIRIKLEDDPSSPEYKGKGK